MADKVIVTGGCGYIGSHTVIELIESGFQVLILDDLSNSSKDSLTRIEKITGVLPEFFELNLANEKNVFQVKKRIKMLKR